MGEDMAIGDRCLWCLSRKHNGTNCRKRPRGLVDAYMRGEEAERKRILEKVRKEKKYWVTELACAAYTSEGAKDKDRGRVSELEFVEKLLEG